MNNKEAKKAAEELFDELRNKGYMMDDTKKIAGQLYKLSKKDEKAEVKQ
jgi:hypothetical protein